MKRIFLSLIFVIILIGSSFSADAEKKTTAVFEISGYKLPSSIKSKTPILEITDAVPEELHTIKDGNEIDLTDAINDLLGYSIEDTQGIDKEKHVAFSFRIYGNSYGKWTLTIDMGKEPFRKVYDDGTMADDGDSGYWENLTIDYAYSLVNTQFSLNTTVEGEEKYLPTPISVDTDKKNYSYSHNNGTAGTPGDPLIFMFESQDTTTAISINNKDRDVIWVVRGVVSLVISANDYAIAAGGKYKLPVTITFIGEQ